MNILSIGGSDPSSGAGIQSDVRAASALGVNCFSVVTAITAQNSLEFSHVEPVSPKSVGMQIDSIFTDFDVGVINIGMVYDSDTIQKIHSKLRGQKIPIILDPVIKSTTGGSLLKKSALDALKRFLVPISYVITPNVMEAELLSGIKITKHDDLKKASKILVRLGAKNVVITGHSFVKNKISDFVYENGKNYSITGKKITGVNHGSGCNFTIALAYSIAQKHKLKDSVEFAKQFAFDAIKHAQSLGRGVKITNPTIDKIKSELGVAIKEFEDLTDVHSLIPECQTNFVFAKQNPKSINDIAGVLGRIVRAGNGVVVAGNLEYGGSRHVATAVLTMQKKFPRIRSALNLRFDEKLIKKFAKKKNKILRYDRTKEPKGAKLKENLSISWGIQNAIKSSIIPPDIIYHKGDFGKEPMIIVFGKNPNEVVTKVSKMLDS